jgi:hypothetical protein
MNKVNNKLTLIIVTVIMTNVFSSASAQDAGQYQDLSKRSLQRYNMNEQQLRNRQIAASVSWNSVLTGGSSGFFGEYAGFRYNDTDGTFSNFYTADFSVDLVQGIKEHFDIMFGCGISRYSSTYRSNLIEGRYDTPDFYQSSINYRYYLNNYIERQTLDLLFLSTKLRYKSETFSDIDMRWYFTTGFRVGMPVSGKATIEQGWLTTQAYYPEHELFYNKPTWGLIENYSVAGRQSRVNYNWAAIMTLETGVIFMSNEDISVAAGIYFDGSLNRILSAGNEQHIVQYIAHEYNTAPVHEWMSVRSVMTTNNITGANLLGGGLKITIFFKY